MENANRKARLILRKTKALLDFAKEENNALVREISGLPDGNLCIKAINGSLSCYVSNKDESRSISRKNAKAKQLARKAVAEHEAIIIREFEDILEHAVGKLEAILIKESRKSGMITRNRIPEVFKGFPFSLSVSERKWLKDCIKAESLYPEQLKYKTRKGLMVRSKSELLIADLLDEYGILYIYEPKIRIAGRTVVPDFAIYRIDGTVIFWEHFGLMDDVAYRRKAMDKINLYGITGYRQHTNLICTDENDMRNPTVIRKIIEERLLI